MNKIFEAYSKAFENYEDVIGIHQALYRLFAVTSKDWHVLHGSTVELEGKGILFGDDGESIGKTTASLMLGKYVSDEYGLYKDGLIYPNRNLKPYDKEKGFVDPKEWATKPVRLHAIVCPRIGEPSIERLRNAEAKEALKCTAYAHKVKLLNPACDRYSIFTGSRDTCPKDIRKYVKYYPEFDNIPIYRMFFKKDSDVESLLKEVMEQPTIEHVSAGGVLLSEEKVYLIYKTSRDEWLLPKGHVVRGESLTEAALREVSEETGYQNIKLLAEIPVKTTDFDFEMDGEYHHKLVYYYPLKLIDDTRETDTQDEGEGLEGGWFAFEKAIEMVKHDDQREAIQAAIQI